MHSSCSASFRLTPSTAFFDPFLGHALEDATLCKAGYVCEAGAAVCSWCWNPSQTGYSRWAEQSQSFLYLYRVVRLNCSDANLLWYLPGNVIKSLFYLPCGNLIMISLWKSDQFHTPRWGKNPTSLFIVWTTEHFLGKFEILKALRGNMFSLIILSLLVVITNPNP